MIGDIPVVDAVLHCFNFHPGVTGAPPGRMHEACHLAYRRPEEEFQKYLLTAEQYERPFSPEELLACVFAESQTDIGVFHHIRGMGREGRQADTGEMSPLAAGLAMREQAPGRVLVYAGLTNPFDVPRSLDEIDRLVEEHHVDGLKFYPHDWDSRSQRVEDFLLDDQEIAFPLIERARSRGIKVVGIHKAMGSRLKIFGVADVEDAARAFPDVNFEIVHAGFAFLDDTVRLAVNPNIYLNLEGTSALLMNAPRRFAEIMGSFLRTAMSEPNAQDRIVWATGAMFLHPQPVLERFWNFQMPPDMVEGYGYPELTEEIKRKVLAENFAAMHGTTVEKLLGAIPAGDELRRTPEALDRPWSKVPALP